MSLRIFKPTLSNYVGKSNRFVEDNSYPTDGFSKLNETLFKAVPTAFDNIISPLFHDINPELYANTPTQVSDSLGLAYAKPVFSVVSEDQKYEPKMIFTRPLFTAPSSGAEGEAVLSELFALSFPFIGGLKAGVSKAKDISPQELLALQQDFEKVLPQDEISLGYLNTFESLNFEINSFGTGTVERLINLINSWSRNSEFFGSLTDPLHGANLIRIVVDSQKQLVNINKLNFRRHADSLKRNVDSVIGRVVAGTSGNAITLGVFSSQYDSSNPINPSYARQYSVVHLENKYRNGTKDNVLLSSNYNLQEQLNSSGKWIQVPLREAKSFGDTVYQRINSTIFTLIKSLVNGAQEASDNKVSSTNSLLDNPHNPSTTEAITIDNSLNIEHFSENDLRWLLKRMLGILDKKERPESPVLMQNRNEVDRNLGINKIKGPLSPAILKEALSLDSQGNIINISTDLLSETVTPNDIARLSAAKRLLNEIQAISPESSLVAVPENFLQETESGKTSTLPQVQKQAIVDGKPPIDYTTLGPEVLIPIQEKLKNIPQNTRTEIATFILKGWFYAAVNRASQAEIATQALAKKKAIGGRVNPHAKAFFQQRQSKGSTGRLQELEDTVSSLGIKNLSKGDEVYKLLMTIPIDSIVTNNNGDILYITGDGFEEASPELSTALKLAQLLCEDYFNLPLLAKTLKLEAQDDTNNYLNFVANTNKYLIENIEKVKKSGSPKTEMPRYVADAIDNLASTLLRFRIPLAEVMPPQRSHDSVEHQAIQNTLEGRSVENWADLVNTPNTFTNMLEIILELKNNIASVLEAKLKENQSN